MAQSLYTYIEKNFNVWHRGAGYERVGNRNEDGAGREGRGEVQRHWVEAGTLRCKPEGLRLGCLRNRYPSSKHAIREDIQEYPCPCADSKAGRLQGRALSGC